MKTHIICNRSLHDEGCCWLTGVIPVALAMAEQEHKVYPEAVAALCDGRVTWRADGVPIIWEAH